MSSNFESIDQVTDELAQSHYIADRALSTVLFLAHRLEKPVFLEGEPGVGKTEVAKEYRILMTRLPGLESRFAEQITRFMHKARTVDFLKKPGVSETLDWGRALMVMQRAYLNEAEDRGGPAE